jgi:hypothetical protein
MSCKARLVISADDYRWPRFDSSMALLGGVEEGL